MIVLSFLSLIIIIVFEIRARRHCCKVCKGRTIKKCRMFRLHNTTSTACGIQLYAVYVFRGCKSGHVTVSMKTVMLSNTEVVMKPQEEFDWKSSEIAELCRKAGIPSPIISPLNHVFADHPFEHSDSRKPVVSTGTSR